MAGLHTFGSYRELTNILYLLELALGKEKVMQFAKGDIEHDLAAILNMTAEECVMFLTKCDSIYNYNYKIKEYQITMAMLSSGIKVKQKNPEYEERITEEMNKYYLYRMILEDSEYLQFAEENQLNPETDESKLKFFQKKHNFYQQQAQKMLDKVNSIIISKYFMQEIDEVLSENNCSKEQLKKFGEILTYHGETNDILLSFCNKRRLAMEKFREKSMNDLKNSIQSGTISSANIEDCYFAAKHHHDSGYFEKFKEDFSKLLMPKDPKLYKQFLDTLCKKNTIQDIFDYRFFELETEDGEKTSIFLNEKTNEYFSNNTQTREQIQADEKIEEPESLFHMTIAFTEEFQEAIENFMKLKESIKQKNPNAQIHILNEIVIVTDPINETSYYIMKDNNFYLAKAKELLPESKKSLKVIDSQDTQITESTDNEKNQDDVVNSLNYLLPLDESPFKRFWKNIKDRVLKFFSIRLKNEKESKNENNIVSETNNSASFSEDFNNRLHVDTLGKYTPEEQKQGNTSKGKDIDCTKQ